ncbi:MAG: cyclic nucleotide-binding domain-containing protein [Candidatus Omnitrophica bacterium]|nr:cyclic nucleotide-binding domain-containing protein [Candidatus Omnitrophota bacterium]MDD5671475.1 cyclic nucleotide-binding domain-containing protein [Candidatus Omnitrophota bacterium]
MAENKHYLLIENKENVFPILSKIAIFGGLSEKQFLTVLELLKRVTYQSGEMIFREGDPASHIYIVRSGEVRVVVGIDQESLEIATFTTGQCFGETAVIGIQPHSASAIAMSDTELIVLEGRALFSIYDADKELFGMLILNIAREACRRLHQTDEVLLHYVLRENHLGAGPDGLKKKGPWVR